MREIGKKQRVGVNMVEADIIAFAGIAILLLYIFNVVFPYRHPEEYRDEAEETRLVSTV